MKPTIGRIVHYVLKKDGDRLVIRPAIITAVWSDTCVNLTVFQDYHNDRMCEMDCHPTSRSLNVEKQVGTWHWPERVELRDGDSVQAAGGGTVDLQKA